MNTIIILASLIHSTPIEKRALDGCDSSNGLFGKNGLFGLGLFATKNCKKEKIINKIKESNNDINPLVNETPLVNTNQVNKKSNFLNQLEDSQEKINFSVIKKELNPTSSNLETKYQIKQNNPEKMPPILPLEENLVPDYAKVNPNNIMSI